MSDAVYARSGAPFFSELDNAPTGLVGTLGVQVLRKSDGTVVSGRTTAGIVESPTGSGRYVFSGTAPLAAGSYTVLWDQGSVTPETTAADDLEVVTTSSIDVLPTGEGLCTPDEVAAALGRAPTPPAPWAEREIAVAEQWIRNYLGAPDLGSQEAPVTVAHDVRSDAFVYAPAPAAKVEVQWAAGGTWEALGATAWSQEDDGVRLRWYGGPSWPYGYGRQSDAEAAPQWYAAVRVTGESTAAVDPLVKFACALAAAAVMTRAPRLAKGLTGERIGDYSYTVASLLTGDPFFEQAKALLRTVGTSRGVTAT